jgi:hypothetical protein
VAAKEAAAELLEREIAFGPKISDSGDSWGGQLIDSNRCGWICMNITVGAVTC